ncbi:MGMT family protein [Thiopseudomonas alkaliphila]|uniref:methylated-DNA--[protein]-cysteine S-methyltransferase n=1 Tax=Thiopseudomonas alkaliphila TaxID=1697053 RepID=UPI00069F6FB5
MKTKYFIYSVQGLYLALELQDQQVSYAALAQTSETAQQLLAEHLACSPTAVLERLITEPDADLQALIKRWQQQQLTVADFIWQGSAFQQQVWQALLSIPPGETRSYQQLAVQLQRPRAYRAVANACGANSIAWLVPCHRVVRSDGSLSGYRWGIALKQQLLAKEAVARAK